MIGFVLTNRSITLVEETCGFLELIVHEPSRSV